MNPVHRSMALMLVFAEGWAAEEALLAKLHGQLHVVQAVWLRFALHAVALGLLLAWRAASAPSTAS